MHESHHRGRDAAPRRAPRAPAAAGTERRQLGEVLLDEPGMELPRRKGRVLDDRAKPREVGHDTEHDRLSKRPAHPRGRFGTVLAQATIFESNGS